MKYFILAGMTALFVLSQSAYSAQAQSATEIRQICYNKYALTYTQRMNATEQRRIDAEKKRLACIRSGGKT